ncbi:hypothetical protein [Fluviicola chungangensis]|uniref:Tetratricopeptide repeat protein n=1 Tax=Fluviicola chungangensis TaxID=2597671 RepID=A0A556MMQ1_9FLAO|nr:hypothetical protein [Fluviicola chungangensis]TSJ41155.1 hypothetical protein FO442_14680 [Fluviicola chungangensis]
MKYLILIFVVLASQCSFGQLINHIEYKKDCNIVYLRVDSSKYKAALTTLKKLEKKYGSLYTEEYILRAFCYHKLNNNKKASIAMEVAWSHRICDPAYLNQIDGFDWVKMGESFNEKEKKRLNQGYENNLKLRSKDFDSLAFLVKELSDKDQKYRAFLSPKKMESLGDSLSILSIEQDSLNILEFERIYSKYGFPGEQISCLFSTRLLAFLLHSADYNWFVDRMRPKFLIDVKNGDMPASLFLIWVDRNSNSNGKKEEFAMYVNPKSFEATPLEIQLIKQARLEYGIVNSFRVPYNFTHH